MPQLDPRSVEARGIGLVLTLLRGVRGWNQDELAKASGIRNSAISDYERCRKLPELATLERLLAAMDFPLAAIDLTRSYVAALRTGIYPAWTAARDPSGESPPPPNGTRFNRDAAQLAQALGAAVSGLAATALGLLARERNGLPAQEPQPACEVHPRHDIDRRADP